MSASPGGLREDSDEHLRTLHQSGSERATPPAGPARRRGARLALTVAGSREVSPNHSTTLSPALPTYHKGSSHTGARFVRHAFGVRDSTTTTTSHLPPVLDGPIPAALPATPRASGRERRLRAHMPPSVQLLDLNTGHVHTSKGGHEHGRGRRCPPRRREKKHWTEGQTAARQRLLTHEPAGPRRSLSAPLLVGTTLAPSASEMPEVPRTVDSR